MLHNRYDVQISVSSKGYEELRSYVNAKAVDLGLGRIISDTALVNLQYSGNIEENWYGTEWGTDTTSRLIMDGLKHLKENGYSYSFYKELKNPDVVESHGYNADGDNRCYDPDEVNEISYMFSSAKIEFAKEKSLDNFAMGDKADNPTSFEFDGATIVCPWMDETGRFELTDAQAVEKYGLELIIAFVDKICRDSEDFAG